MERAKKKRKAFMKMSMAKHGGSASNPLDHLSPKALSKLLMNRDEAMRTYKEADTNGDGILQQGEFQALFAKLDCGISAKDVDALYKSLDRDGDGMVDCKELFNALSDSGEFSKVQVLKVIPLSSLSAPPGKTDHQYVAPLLLYPSWN